MSVEDVDEGQIQHELDLMRSIGLDVTLRRARDVGVLDEAMRGIPSVTGANLSPALRAARMPSIFAAFERLRAEVETEGEGT